MQDDLYRYYGWDPMWGGGYFGAGAAPTPLMPVPGFTDTMLRERTDQPMLLTEGDPHLRSIATVKGYDVHATDGDIGHVENLLLDDGSWLIHYLIIDTKNWWFGQHVLVSPYAVREISWSNEEVRLDITRARVKSSPPWDPMAAIDRAYQRELHGYYGWPGYGW
jgi:hypothetical protein